MATVPSRRPPSKHDPVCSVCEQKRAPVIFNTVGTTADDVHLNCDTCLEPCCADCCDVDDEGIVTCSNCLQTAAAQAGAFKKGE